MFENLAFTWKNFHRHPVKVKYYENCIEEKYKLYHEGGSLKSTESKLLLDEAIFPWHVDRIPGFTFYHST